MSGFALHLVLIKYGIRLEHLHMLHTYVQYITAVWTQIDVKQQKINKCDQCSIVLLHMGRTTPLFHPHTLENRIKLQCVWYLISW